MSLAARDSLSSYEVTAGVAVSDMDRAKKLAPSGRQAFEIDNAEVINAVHGLRAPMMPASAGLRL